MSTYPQHSQEEPIDIKKYLIKFLNNWYWILLSTGVSLFVAFMITRYSTPQYSVSTTMLISDGSSDVSEVVSGLSALTGKSVSDKIENEIPILKSYTLARKVVADLNLSVSYFNIGKIKTSECYTDSPFYIIYDSAKYSFNGMVSVSLRDDKRYILSYTNPVTDETIKTEMQYDSVYIDSMISFSLHLKEPFKERNALESYTFKVENLDKLALAYMNSMGAEAISKDSYVVKLSLSGAVPQKIVDYLNKVTDTYIKMELEAKNRSFDNAIQFIDNQLASIVDSLEIAENNLEAFRRNNKIINLSQEGQALFQKIEAVQEQKSQIDIQMKYFDYLLSYVKSKTDFKDVVTPSVIGIQDELLNSLIAQLSELYREKSLIEYSSQKYNPSLELINLKIANNKAALEENLNNVISGASIERNEIRDRLISLNKEMQALPAIERRYVNIQRQFTVKDNIYTFLLEKKADAGVVKASNMPTAKIVDSAYTHIASKISPKVSLNYAIALFLGILFPILYIILSDFFNTKITDVKEIQDKSKLPFLGIVPHDSNANATRIWDFPASTLAESYRSIRYNIQYITKGRTQLTIAVSSTVSGEGKTFTSLNLASVYAMAKKKTILIGLDLRRPTLHQLLNVNNEKGISSIAIGNNTWQECVISVSDNLDFIPSGPIAPNPAELLESLTDSHFWTELKNQYEVIILDTTPVALVPDAFILKDHVDATVYVVRQGFSSKEVLQYSNDLSTDSKLVNPAIVLNDVSKQTGYFSDLYGNGYRYNYSYSEYASSEIKNGRLSAIKNFLHLS